MSLFQYDIAVRIIARKRKVTDGIIDIFTTVVSIIGDMARWNLIVILENKLDISCIIVFVCDDNRFFTGIAVINDILTSQKSLKVIYLPSTAEGHRSEKRMNILLFPNTHDKDNKIRAGETTVIGRLGELEINPPYGRDVITVVASERQFTDLEETLRQAKGRYYSEVTSSTRGTIKMRSRGIEVVEPVSSSDFGAGQEPSVLGSVATDTCFIVSHPR